MGSIESATLTWLTGYSKVDEPLGQVALSLSRSLDEGAGMAAAAVARELRATLKELAPRDGGDEFTRLMAELSAEVRDSAET